MRNLSEFLITLTLIAIVLVNLYWMPEGRPATIFLICAGLFVAFVVFMWREKRGDERDTYMRNIVGRVGYLAGALVLSTGIIYEAFAHDDVNRWLIASLTAMIFAKIVSFIWAKRRC